MKESILVTVVAVVLVGSGCAYFRPSQTEAQRLREQQSVRQDEYLKGSFLDGLVETAGNALMNNGR